MSIVNALRFDAYSGAVIADEESWHLRLRRTYFGDNLRSLLSPAVADQLGIEIVYGGVGNPAVHHETYYETYRFLNSGKSDAPIPRTVEEIARTVLSNLQKTLRRRADDKLKYLYGFTSDDVTRGFFEVNGEKYDIKQESVKERALKIATLKEKATPGVPLPDDHALVAGYDPENGFSMYCLKGEISVVSLVSGGFESLGSGKYAAGMSFAKFLNRKFLSERKKGFDRVEGMVELISSALTAASYFAQVGGYFSIVYINGRGKSHAERYHEIYHHRAKIATEVVMAYGRGYLPKAITYELIDGIVFGDMEFEAAEEEMFKRSKNPAELELVLRGYKIDEGRRSPLECSFIKKARRGNA